MGRWLAKTALEHNDMVAMVGHTFENSDEEMKKLGQQGNNSLGLSCDVRVRETIASVIDQTIQCFGRIDIVVNSSGYGVVGACEVCARRFLLLELILFIY